MSSRRRRTLTLACSVVLFTAASAEQLCGQITAKALGAFHLCDTLGRVDAIFPSARDTTPLRESSTKFDLAEPPLSGIAKVLRVGRDEWVLFETESIDSVHVWRIRTNSSKYQTPRGYRVGMLAIDLLHSGANLEVLAPIGFLYLEADGVSFLVDDSSARAFWKRYDARKPASVGVKLLGPNARIKELLIASPCEE